MAGEACPLCAEPLHEAQAWCMHCGAPARTRLAPAPRWRGLVAVLALVIVGAAAALTIAIAALAGS